VLLKREMQQGAAPAQGWDSPRVPCLQASTGTCGDPTAHGISAGAGCHGRWDAHKGNMSPLHGGKLILGLPKAVGGPGGIWPAQPACTPCLVSGSIPGQRAEASHSVWGQRAGDAATAGEGDSTEDGGTGQRLQPGARLSQRLAPGEPPCAPHRVPLCQPGQRLAPRGQHWGRVPIALRGRCRRGISLHWGWQCFLMAILVTRRLGNLAVTCARGWTTPKSSPGVSIYRGPVSALRARRAGGYGAEVKRLHGAGNPPSPVPLAPSAGTLPHCRFPYFFL